MNFPQLALQAFLPLMTQITLPSHCHIIGQWQIALKHSGHCQTVKVVDIESMAENEAQSQ